MYDINNTSENDWNVIEFLLGKTKEEIIESCNINQSENKPTKLTYKNYVHEFDIHDITLPTFDILISTLEKSNRKKVSILPKPARHVPIVRIDLTKDLPVQPVITKKHRQSRLKGKNLEIMTQYYRLNKHPPIEDRQKLADAIGRSVRFVQIWFQNMRAKEKRRNTSPSY